MSEKLYDTDLVQVEQVESIPQTWTTLEKEIKLSPNTASQISMSLSQLAGLGQAELMSHAYIVRFPKGVEGALVQHDGGYLTTMHALDSSKFVGTSTMYPIEKIAAVAQVANVLSIGTGQYFLASINKQLESIHSEVDRIMSFLEHDKAAEIYAESRALNNIYTNYTSIMKSPQLQTASLTTVQRIKAFAERNIQFYYMEMSELMNTLSQGEYKNVERRFAHYKDGYAQAINMYGVSVVLEIELAQNFDKDFITYQENELAEHIKVHNELMNNFRGQVKAIKAKESTSKLPGTKAKLEILKKLGKDLKELIGPDSPVAGFETVISQIEKNYTEPCEYRILQDGTVYKAELRA